MSGDELPEVGAWSSLIDESRELPPGNGPCWRPAFNYLLLGIAAIAWVVLPALLIWGGDARWVALVLLAVVSIMAVRAPISLRPMDSGQLVVRRLFSTQVIERGEIVSITRTSRWGFGSSYTSGPQYLIKLERGSIFVPIGPFGDRDVIEVLLARNPEISDDGLDVGRDD